MRTVLAVLLAVVFAVSVASAPTHQNTLHGLPPLAITTVRLVAVRPAGISNNQGPVLPVRFRV